MKRLAPIVFAVAGFVGVNLPDIAHARGKARHVTRKVKAHGKKRRHVVERAVPTYTHGGMPNVQAHAAVVLDMEKGEELFAKNADEVRSIASISKLMAMMVVLDRGLDLDKTTVIVDDDRKLAVRGARSRLPVGLSFTNRDLLHAALMASDNRAVPALGRAVGLAPEILASEMSKKAIALGLTHTSFGDPTGLDDRNHSTPREVARFLMAAIRYPLIAEITRKATYLTRAVDPRRHYAVEYTNTDVWARGKRYQVLGGKTGYTDLAGYCLAIAAHLDGRGDVAMVFLGEQGKMTRFADFARAATWIAEKKPGGLIGVASAKENGAPAAKSTGSSPSPSPSPSAEGHSTTGSGPGSNEASATGSAAGVTSGSAAATGALEAAAH